MATKMNCSCGASVEYDTNEQEPDPYLSDGYLRVHPKADLFLKQHLSHGDITHEHIYPID